jgi:hypothetical protein
VIHFPTRFAEGELFRVRRRKQRRDSLAGLRELEPADVISTLFNCSSWAKGLRSHNVR